MADISPMDGMTLLDARNARALLDKAASRLDALDITDRDLRKWLDVARDRVQEIVKRYTR